MIIDHVQTVYPPSWATHIDVIPTINETRHPETSIIPKYKINDKRSIAKEKQH